MAAAGAGQDGQASGGADSQLTIGEQIEAMTEKLSARLKQQPDDAEGWSMLARSYTVLGRHPEALPAYERAVAIQILHCLPQLDKRFNQSQHLCHSAVFHRKR